MNVALIGYGYWGINLARTISNTDGYKLVTIFDEDINRINEAKKLYEFDDVLLSILQSVKEIDFAFIDGHHDKDATIEYFNVIKPFLSNDAIVVFDDISWSSGMIESWEILKKDKKFIKYDDLKKLGICYCGGDDDLV